MGVNYIFEKRQPFEGSFYDSDGIELLAKSAPVPKLELIKPDGTSASLVFAV